MHMNLESKNSQTNFKTSQLSKAEIEFQAADNRYIYAAPNQKRKRLATPTVNVVKLHKAPERTNSVSTPAFGKLSNTCKLPSFELVNRHLCSVFPLVVQRSARAWCGESLQFHCMGTEGVIQRSVQELNKTLNDIFGVDDSTDPVVQLIVANLSSLCSSNDFEFSVTCASFLLLQIGKTLGSDKYKSTINDAPAALYNMKAKSKIIAIAALTVMQLPHELLRHCAANVWSSLTTEWLCLGLLVAQTPLPLHNETNFKTVADSKIASLCFLLDFGAKFPSLAPLDSLDLQQFCIFGQKVLALAQARMSETYHGQLVKSVLAFFNNCLCNYKAYCVNFLQTPLDKSQTQFMLSYFSADLLCSDLSNELSFLSFYSSLAQHVSWITILRLAPNTLSQLFKLSKLAYASAPIELDNLVSWLPRLRLLLQLTKVGSPTDARDHLLSEFLAGNKHQMLLLRSICGKIFECLSDFDFKTQDDTLLAVNSRQYFYLELYQIVQELFRSL